MPLASAIDSSGYIFYVALAHKGGSIKPLDLIKEPEAKTARCRYTVNEESVKVEPNFTDLDPILI